MTTYYTYLYIFFKLLNKNLSYVSAEPDNVITYSHRRLWCMCVSISLDSEQVFVNQ